MRLMSLFRERLLARLVEAHAISREIVAKLLAWKHPGFSSHVGEPIAAKEEQRLEDTAAYLVSSAVTSRRWTRSSGSPVSPTASPTRASAARSSTASTRTASDQVAIACLLGYGVPVFTDDATSSNYPVFKGPATL
jgi:hypothetical protein